MSRDIKPIGCYKNNVFAYEQKSKDHVRHGIEQQSASSQKNCQ